MWKERYSLHTSDTRVLLVLKEMIPHTKWAALLEGLNTGVWELKRSVGDHSLQKCIEQNI